MPLDYAVDEDNVTLTYTTKKDRDKPVKIVVKKDGNIQDLTSYTNPFFKLYDNSGNKVTVASVASVTDAANGILTYFWGAPASVVSAGEYGCCFDIDDPDGATVPVPSRGLIQTIIEDLDA